MPEPSTVELRALELGRYQLTIDGQHIARVTKVSIEASAGRMPKVIVELAPHMIMAALVGQRAELPPDLCTALEALGWTRPEEKNADA